MPALQAKVLTVPLMVSSVFGTANALGSAVALLNTTDNVAVYWGQNSYGASSGPLEQQPLATYCANTDINIIPMAFAVQITSGTDGQPVVNFANSGNNCTIFPGTGLLDCPQIGEDIRTCQQQYNKTILLSIGGSTYTEGGFTSSDSAVAAAELVWATFGPQGNSTSNATSAAANSTTASLQTSTAEAAAANALTTNVATATGTDLTQLITRTAKLTYKMSSTTIAAILTPPTTLDRLTLHTSTPTLQTSVSMRSSVSAKGFSLQELVLPATGTLITLVSSIETCVPPSVAFDFPAGATPSFAPVTTSYLRADIGGVRSRRYRLDFRHDSAATSDMLTKNTNRQDRKGAVPIPYADTHSQRREASILRPFGDAVVDGFDLDLESTNQNFIPFTNRLRYLMNQDTSKQYYLTAAPQCPYPDLANNDLLNGGVRFDAIFVQFYNNYCGLQSFTAGNNTQSDFNFDTWDGWAKNGSANPNVKIFLGIPAGPTAAGSGYMSVSGLTAVINYVRGFSSFGGIMMWDASQAQANLGFLLGVKSALQTPLEAVRKTVPKKFSA